jgi:hypothetical protein
MMAKAPSLRRSSSLTAADRMVLRLAFAATFAFAIAALRDWEFSFLAPMLAIQILAATPACPNFRQGATIPLVIFLSTNIALGAATLLMGTPVVLLAAVGVVICWAFYGQRRGAPAIAVLLVQIAFCCVPLIATISLDVARDFGDFLLWSSIAAIITVWIAYALFPQPPSSTPAASGPAPIALSPARAAHVAISDALVLFPLLVTFIVRGDINNIVILMITINLLREIELAHSRRLALAILLANLLGGVLAVFAHQFILLPDNLLLFLLTVFLAGLWFSGRLVRGGPMAPVYALAFGTFLLVLGLAITPLPGGAEELFTVRISKIVLASLYAIGALSLVARIRLGPRPNPTL